MRRLPEFRRDALEALRQPLEDGIVTLARATATFAYPARFTLAMEAEARPVCNLIVAPGTFP